MSVSLLCLGLLVVLLLLDTNLANRRMMMERGNIAVSKREKKRLERESVSPECARAKALK